MSWKYDIVVALILAFIFLTPRDVFKDQPRAVGVVQIRVLPKKRSSGSIPLKCAIPPRTNAGKRRSNCEAAYGEDEWQLIRLETVADPDDEVKGFMAFLKP